MKTFKAAADRVASQHKDIFSPDRGPVYSFDNAPIHQAANLRALGIEGHKRALLPPSSPDMHKCIEHVFGTLVQAMKDSLGRNASLSTAAQYKDEVERLFNTAITRESVQKDVASLKDTYRSIKDDVAGDWPPRHLR